MASLNAPDTENLRVGRGILSFQETGATEARDLGEVPECELSLTIEKLDYFTSRAGIRSKTKSVVLERGGQLRFVMNSFTPANMALFFLGTVTENTISQPTFDILDQDAIAGQIYFHGTNSVGPRYDFHLHNVEISPTGSFNFIDEDDWSGVEVTAEMLLSTVTNKFGVVTLTNLDTDT
jgi:hypothetical protein